MRILKRANPRIIAGEIINISRSTLYFLDGELVDVPKKGYPVVTNDNKDYVFSMTRASIYVEETFLVPLFAKDIKAALVELEAMIPPKTPYPEKVSAHTSWVPDDQKTATSICLANDGVDWTLLDIKDAFDTRVGEPGAYLRAMGDIIVDSGDVTTYDNNEIIFTPDVAALRGTSGCKSISSLMIYRHAFGYSVLPNLSKYWKHKPNITLKRVDVRGYVAFEELRLNPVMTSRGPNGSICAACRSPLSGDIYVLIRPNKQIPMCAICKHTHTNTDNDAEIVRTTFPVSDLVLLNEATWVDNKDALGAALKGIEVLHLGGENYVYLLGDDYVGAYDAREFLFGGAWKHKKVLGRKFVCIRACV